MNMNDIFFNLNKFLIILILSSFPMLIFAKEINIYDQPRTDAKIIAKIDLSEGIIPIYKPKEGKWIKIADPKNGNVGWVLSSTVADANKSASMIIYKQSTSNNSKEQPTTFQVIQFGQPNHLSLEQRQKLLKQMEFQRQAFHHSMQVMFNEMNRLMENEFHFVDNSSMPFIIIPEQKSQKLTNIQQTSEQHSSTKVESTSNNK